MTDRDNPLQRVAGISSDEIRALPPDFILFEGPAGRIVVGGDEPRPQVSDKDVEEFIARYLPPRLDAGGPES